jgi:predicted heme/steroid binding protein
MKKALALASTLVLLSGFSVFAEEANMAEDNNPKEMNQEMNQEMLPEMTIQELSKYTGKGGSTAYIAVDGIIYDVTNAKGWKDGVHTKSGGKIVAGIDASKEIEKSPHKKAVLKDLKKVGKLKK